MCTRNRDEIHWETLYLTGLFDVYYQLLLLTLHSQLLLFQAALAFLQLALLQHSVQYMSSDNRARRSIDLPLLELHLSYFEVFSQRKSSLFHF
jgi:hypothetical protein